MREVNRNGVHIDVCPKCRGVWLDRGELEKLLDAARAVDAEYERELTHLERDHRRRTVPGHGHPGYRKKKKSLFELFDFDLFD